MFTPEIYTARRAALRKKIKSGMILLPGNADASVNYPANAYDFRQDSNFLYYFGLRQPGFVGLIDVDRDTDCLYADDWTMDDLIWMGPQPTVRELASRSGVMSAGNLQELAATLNSAIKKGRKIHYVPPYRGETRLQLAGWLGLAVDRLKDYVSRDLIRAIVSMREIKQPEEIAQLEEVAQTGYRMHTAAMAMCREGLTERDVAAELDRIAAAGGGRTSFRSIVSQHGETLHNLSYDGRLENGRLLLIDAGAENAMGYASDHTRTLPVGGRFTEKQREIYDIVLAANARGQELARPGVTYQSVHLEAMRVIAEGLTQLGLMRGDPAEAVAAGAAALFMPHGLGHQMGLDVHDMEGLGEKYVGYDDATTRSTQFGLGALRMGKTLKAGHVVTVEPGIYFIPALIEKWEREHIHSSFINFPKLRSYFDFGGIRLEDDILITATGNRLVGKHRPPIAPAEVEAAMTR
ncbi:MAG: aminopeptidase P family protein [Rikenella sp.]|nr:aminopeptidase P family protein [Rikenella sp.]